MSSMLQIANLGSSYAAGPAIPPPAGPLAAGRSGNNFAHLVASHFNGNLTDLTVSGATLDNVLTTPQVVDNTTFAPQINDLPPNQDIVYILGGGNDLGYIGGLTIESVAATSAPQSAVVVKPTDASERNNNGIITSSFSWLWSQALVANQQNLFSSISLFSILRGRDTPTNPALQTVADKLGLVADKVRATSPNAQIFLIGYLPLISSETIPQASYLPLNQSRIDFYRGVYDGLASAYVEASRTRQWLTLVGLDNDETYAHALGSQDPWVWGFDSDEAWYHPSTLGHQVVAQKLIELVKPKA